ncbi:MAG: hypothetical protein LBB81_07010, partial [Treponema sp.]|nr:hypothetical protein [Treponema sp.]
MKLKFRLSIIVIAIVVAVAGSIAFILLQQASSISLRLNIQSMVYLNNEQAAYWEGRENRYFEVIRTVAAMMADYESIPAAERRDRFDDMLLAAMKSQPNFTRIASI